MEANEFEKDRQLDPNALDVECLQQADLFFKWAERAVEAKGKADRCKLRMEVIEAKLGRRCREKPEQFGLARVTELGVQSAVKCHKSYTNAYRKWIRARETAQLLDKAVEAMEQRKRMLEVLITLHGQQYFAGPSVPRDLVSAWKEQTEKRDQRTTKRTAKRARKRGS